MPKAERVIGGGADGESGAGRGPASESCRQAASAEDYFAQRGNPTDADNGHFSVTKAERDKGRFKVPTLRNVALTYPYFHDGSISDLAEAVTIMARYQLGLSYDIDQSAQLVDFLKTLTGEYQGKPL